MILKTLIEILGEEVVKKLSQGLFQYVRKEFKELRKPSEKKLFSHIGDKIAAFLSMLSYYSLSLISFMVCLYALNTALTLKPFSISGISQYLTYYSSLVGLSLLLMMTAGYFSILGNKIRYQLQKLKGRKNCPYCLS